MKNKMPCGSEFVHITLSVTVNGESYSWADPNANQSVQISIPRPLFERNAFASYIEGIVSQVSAQFQIEKVKWEAEQAQKEKDEAEKSE